MTPTPIRDYDIFGIGEIAEAIGPDTKGATVSQWYKRGKLPKPDRILGTGPVWHGRTIRAFVKEQRARTQTDE